MVRKFLVRALLFALVGLVVVPALAYTVGQFLVGPYEGSDGILGYLTTIYRNLADGSIIAVAFVISPLGIVAVWLLTSWLLGRQQGQPSDSE